MSYKKIISALAVLNLSFIQICPLGFSALPTTNNQTLQPAEAPTNVAATVANKNAAMDLAAQQQIPSAAQSAATPPATPAANAVITAISSIPTGSILSISPASQLYMEDVNSQGQMTGVHVYTIPNSGFTSLVLDGTKLNGGLSELIAKFNTIKSTGGSISVDPTLTKVVSQGGINILQGVGTGLANTYKISFNSSYPPATLTSSVDSITSNSSTNTITMKNTQGVPTNYNIPPGYSFSFNSGTPMSFAQFQSESQQIISAGGKIYLGPSYNQAVFQSGAWTLVGNSAQRIVKFSVPNFTLTSSISNLVNFFKQTNALPYKFLPGYAPGDNSSGQVIEVVNPDGPFVYSVTAPSNLVVKNSQGQTAPIQIPQGYTIVMDGVDLTGGIPAYGGLDVLAQKIQAVLNAGGSVNLSAPYNTVGLTSNGTLQLVGNSANHQIIFSSSYPPTTLTSPVISVDATAGTIAMKNTLGLVVNYKVPSGDSILVNGVLMTLQDLKAKLQSVSTLGKNLVLNPAFNTAVFDPKSGFWTFKGNSQNQILFNIM